MIGGRRRWLTSFLAWRIVAALVADQSSLMLLLLLLAGRRDESGSVPREAVSGAGRADEVELVVR